MMFLSESMYGWGVYDIAMPRAVYHTLSDKRRRTRRKWTRRILFWGRQRRTRRISDRRSQKSILSIALGLLVHNFPCIQVLVLSLVSLLCFALIYMISKAIPEHPDKQLSMPVDMIISVMEEEKVVPVPEKIEQKPTLEPVVKTKPIEKPELVPIQEEKISLEIPLPNIRDIHEIEKRPKATQPVALKNPIQEEKISFEIPLPNIRDIHEIKKRPKATQPVALKNLIQEEKITPEISLPNIRDIHEIEKRPKATQMAASKSSSFDKTTQDEEIIRISDLVVPKQHYSINRVARKFRAKQPDFISNSFSKQPDTPAVIISQANSSKKKYTIDTSNRKISTPSDKISGSNVFASSQSVKSTNVTLPETDQINERYSLAKHDGPYQLSPLSQTDNQSLSFAHQNKEEQLTLTPLINTKSVSKKSRPIQGNPTGGEQAPDFSSAMTGEIDPSYLINLKKFSVCADPEEEFRLKTKLAARLDGPSKFGKNGIIFFFKYTETGYTIDIDIYNPQGERFQDRCSVLQLAIESIENTKK